MRKTYGTLKKFDADKWVIDKVPPHVSLRIKDVFRQVGTSVRPPFFFKATRELEADLKWFMDRYPLLMSIEDRELLEKGANAHYEKMQVTEHFYSGNYKPSNLNLKDGMALENYQGLARDLFWEVEELLLADAVGLGKTPTAIASLLRPEMLPAIVVVQSHLNRQWKKEFKKFTDLNAFIIPNGKAKPLPLADVYIAKYTTAAKWVDYLTLVGAKTLILDEVQEVRHLDTKKHEACVELYKASVFHLALSGSPIYNYGIETWNIYQVIKPSIFPSRDEFIKAWCDYGGRVKDPEALGAYLMETRSYLRRTKEDVGSEIPPLNKIIQAVDYEEKAILDMEKRAKVLARNIFQGEYIERGMAARELSIMVRKATGVSKARSVAAFVRIILESNEPVVLAGWHRDVYDIWKEEFKDFNPVFYTGTESQNQKDQAKQDFIDRKTNLFIISLRSGVGLDGLQEVASYVVFGELDWSPAIHEQVIGRLYRYGQKKQVTAIFCVSDSGSDPLVIDMNGIKKSQSAGIFDPLRNAVDSQESDDTIIKEYARKLLNKRMESEDDRD
ncbi:hypothetical protein MASR1M48_16930 [Lactococcus petauri]